MDNFFGRIRSGAEQAAGKAAFEADKLRRVTALQGKVRSLKGSFEQHIIKTGQTAYSLFQQEQIEGPEALHQACSQLAAIQAQIAAHEQQIEAVRAETFEGAPASPQYGSLCPNGHGVIPPQDNFCQVCGAKAVVVSPPQGTALCPNCNAALPLDARFCAECGQDVQQVAPPTAAVGTACANCGAALLPDSAFCTECGHRVTAVSSPPVPEEPADVEFTSTEFTEEPDKVDPPTAAESAPALSPEEELVLTQGEDDEEETAVSHEETAPETCPVCAAPLVPEALFCTECGHRFGEGGPT